MTRMTPSLSLVLALAAPLPALAAQNLIPSPYPSASPGTAPLNPSASSTAPSQSLAPTPYPQATPGSQGNAPNATMGGPQQRVPSTYQRNYGVEQH